MRKTKITRILEVISLVTKQGDIAIKAKDCHAVRVVDEETGLTASYPRKHFSGSVKVGDRFREITYTIPL